MISRMIVPLGSPSTTAATDLVVLATGRIEGAAARRDRRAVVVGGGAAGGRDGRYLLLVAAGRLTGPRMRGITSMPSVARAGA